jgi:GUN4-like
MSNGAPGSGNNSCDWALFWPTTISGVIAGVIAGFIVTFFQPRVLESIGVVKPGDRKAVIDCERQLNNKGFTELQPLCSPLKNNFLKTADTETYNAIGRLIHGDKWGKGQKTTYTAQAILDKKICPQLKEIDELWKEASKGKLGFSVQKKIWENARGYQNFINTVGWLNSDGAWKNSLSYELKSIQNGHLPALWNQTPADSLLSSKKEYETFFEVYAACEQQQ